MSMSRRRLLMSATSMAAISLAAACSDPDRVEPPSPASNWRLPDPGPFTVTEHEWIPMSDGVRLSARIWLPNIPDADPPPAVLEYIPYRKRDLYRPYDDIHGEMLASRGIAYVRVDVRGTGDSEGLITDEYAEPELADGVAIIEWISKQDWCSGAVGMRGISWGGINTLQIAARRPPALKAIMPMCCTDNRYTDDAHFIGGALGHTNFQWGVLFKNVMASPPDPAITGDHWADAWRNRLEAAPPILKTWTERQSFDAYWENSSLAPDYAAINVPTYLVGGWQDAYNDALARMLERLDVPKKALIGPWGHTYPNMAAPNGLDWAQDEVRWWSHWLKDEPTGIMDEPLLWAFMPDQTARQSLPELIPGRWVAEPAWPPASAALQFHLNPASMLGAEPLAGPALSLRDNHIVGLTKPEWLDRLPIEQSHDDARSLVFDTAPLDTTVEILGHPLIHLRLAADQPVAHVAVRLCEITPDGQSWLISHALRNLTHRNSHDQPLALEPDQPIEIDLKLALAGHRFNSGSRIRIAISPSLWPLVWPTPTPATLSIHPGVSSLTLPVRRHDDLQARFAIPLQTTPTPPPASYAPAEPNASGRIAIANNTPAFTYPVPGVGTQLTSGATENSEIVAGDPSSSRWSAVSRSAWKRDDWDCALEAGYELTADASTFHLREWLIAHKDGEVFFEQSTTSQIPRRLV